MGVFVGLDCGGSSSRVMAVDEIGNILFQGQSGSANLVSTPENRLRKNLSHAIDGCPTPTHVCGCFAGLINEDLRSKGIEQLKHLFPSAQLRAEPDYTAAFYASEPDTDVCVIAGTGSLVCSLGKAGMAKSGGRGYLLGDEGSAYQFGRDAIRHYLRVPNEASDSLRDGIQSVFGTLNEPEIVAQIYRGATPAGILAKFAKYIGQDAKAGHAYAIQSLDRNLGDLIEVLTEHLRRNPVDKPTLTISLAGGVWKGVAVFRERFAELASERLSDREVRVARIQRPPLYGAVQLAREIKYGN